MKKTKRFLLVLLYLIIIVSVSLTGCSKNNDNKIAGDRPEENPGNEGTDKVPTEELSIFTWDNWYAPKSYASGELPVINEIEKRLNIKIKWVVLPASEFTTAASIKYATGQKLEDIIMGGSLTYLINNGIIINFDTLIGDNTPNIVKLLNDRPELKKFMTHMDGKMYEFPYIMDDFPSLDANWIRKDWLDKLNIPLPKTPEEYLSVLKLFREHDANGNGKKDEVYACCSNYFEFLSNIWHMNYSQGNYCINDNGEVEYDYLEERGKLYLQFIYDMWRKDIFDREILNMSYENLLIRLNNDQVGGITWYPWSRSWLSKQVRNPAAEVEYTIVVLEGPYGIQKFYKQKNYLSGGAKITKFCKNPELAMKFFDFVWASEEGFNLINYGIKNISYMEENGDYKYTDYILNNPDGLSTEEALWSIGCYINLPNRQNIKVANKQRLPEDILEMNKIMNYFSPLQVFQYISLTQEEKIILQEIGKELNIYVDEMKIKFMTGEEPISNYEIFGQKLKEMGIQKIMDNIKVIEE